MTALQSTADAVAAYNQKLTTIGLESVIISVGTMTAATLVIALLFNLLRPSNSLVYATRIKYSASSEKPTIWSDPQETTAKKTWFSWVRPLVQTKEPELLAVLGLDAVAFLRFMRMMCWLFTIIAVITCGALFPVNILYNLRSVPFEKRNALAMLSVANVQGNILFVHIGVNYLINLFVFAFIWHNYRRMTSLRGTWFRSPAYLDQIYSRTLSVIRIPREGRSDRQFSALVNTLSLPHPVTSAQVGRQIEDLPDLIQEHNEKVVLLEKCLIKYLQGGKLAEKRPMIRVGGWLGMGGERVDSIEYYTGEVTRMNKVVEDRREELDNEDALPTNYGFVTMASAPLAHRNAQYIDSHDKKLRKALSGAKISAAPMPKDIIWDNITMPAAEQESKKIVAILLLIIVCAFWTIPVVVLSFLANLNSLSVIFPFLQTWQHYSRGTFSAVSGMLPPIVAAVFALLLPMVIRSISKLQGVSTLTALQRLVCGRYFDFLLISQLIVFSLISVIFNLCVGAILQLGAGQSIGSVFRQLNLGGLPGTVQSTYIIESTFWLTWVPARGFSAVFDLAQLINLVTMTVKTKLTGRKRTPREAREWTKPKTFAFEIYGANLLFLCCVGLTYACLAPIVAFATMIVLWIWYFVYKYQLMFVFVTEVESGGRLFPTLINRLLVSMVFSNFLLALTIALARDWLYLLVQVPPLLLILLFKIYLSIRYDRDFLYFLSADKEDSVPEHSADLKRGRLQRRFEHPSLHGEMFTTMLDADLVHLLPQVFNDKSKVSEPLSDGNGELPTTVNQGLTIASVDENQLEYHEESDAVDARSLASISEEGDERVVRPGIGKRVLSKFDPRALFKVRSTSK